MEKRAIDVAKALARLSALTIFELRGEWRRLHRMPPPMRLSRDLLIRGIIYQLQERAYGGLSKAGLFVRSKFGARNVSQSDADRSSHTTGRMSSSKARVQMSGAFRDGATGRWSRSSRSLAKLSRRVPLWRARLSGTRSAAASFIHDGGNCLTVSLAEFATAIWITDLDLHGLNLRHRAKCPRCHQS